MVYGVTHIWYNWGSMMKLPPGRESPCRLLDGLHQSLWTPNPILLCSIG
jgi:hypothetical protein